MIIYQIVFVFLLLIPPLFGTKKNESPTILQDTLVLIQKEDHRNDTTQWNLVWEDQFDTGDLDTNRWSKIGLYTSERLLNNLPEEKTNKKFWNSALVGYRSNIDA